MNTQKKALVVTLLVLLFISCISIFPYFLNPFLYNQDDLLFHRTRLENYYQAVQHFDFFPRVFPMMGLYFGYAADLFYPSILLLPFALFRCLGLNFVSAYYLYQWLISFATALSAFYCMYSLKKSKKSALLFSCFYTLATYRLIDQSVRAALGETLAFIFVPLVVLGAYSIFYMATPRWKTLAISMSLLLASHLITTFYASLFLLLFILFHWKQWSKTKTISILYSGLLAIGLSAWFIFPYLEQLLSISFNFSTMVLWPIGLNFNLADLFSNSLASLSAPYADLKPGIGIFLLTIVLLACFSFTKLTTQNKKLTGLTLAMLMMSTNLFPWGIFRTSIFAAIQFPWRLLLFGSLFASFLAVSIVEQFMLLSTKKVLLFIGLCSFFTLSFNINNLVYCQSNDFLTITTSNFTDFYESEIGNGKEYLVKGTDYAKYFSNPSLIIDGTPYVNSSEQTKNTYLYSRYTLQTNGVQEIQFPKFYYKGYQVVDNKTVVKNYNKNGLLTVKLDPGEHTLTVRYEKTVIQSLSTIFSFILVLCLLVFSFIKKKRVIEITKKEPRFLV